jgi:hypothetical protein
MVQYDTMTLSDARFRIRKYTSCHMTRARVVVDTDFGVIFRHSVIRGASTFSHLCSPGPVGPKTRDAEGFQIVAKARRPGKIPATFFYSDRAFAFNMECRGNAAASMVGITEPVLRHVEVS